MMTRRIWKASQFWIVGLLRETLTEGVALIKLVRLREATRNSSASVQVHSDIWSKRRSASA